MKLLIKFLLPILARSTVYARNGSGAMKSLKLIDERLANSHFNSSDSIGFIFQENSDSSTVFAIAQRIDSNWKINQFRMKS